MAETMTQNDLILSRAKAAVLSRDYTLAARLYKGLLRNDPENVKLLDELASLFVKSGQDDRALPLYKEIVRLQPENINAYNSLGGIYRRLKKYEDSIAMLEQALVVDENNIQVYYNLGFTYKLMGKYEDAIQCFETVVDENPNDVLAFNHMGSTYALTNQHEKAVSAYMRGLKIDPNHPILHLNLAKSYEALGRLDKAGQEYEAALRSKPGWLDAIDGYADLLLKKNKTKDAGDLVQQAIRLNPKNAKMHVKMGTVYAKQSNYDNAESEYTGALEIDPKNEKALSGLADVYEADGKTPDAVKVMKKIEELKPEDSSMLKQYAHILLTANKLNAASRKIKQVWDKNPDDVQTLNLLGQYYICRGETRKTLGCYKKIEEIDPGYTQHYRDGAQRFRQIGQLSKAEKYCLKYLETAPNDPIALSLLAADYEDLGSYAQALDYYRRSAEADKDNVAYQKGVDRLNTRLTTPKISGKQQPAAAEEGPLDLNADFATDASLEIKMDGKDSEFDDSADVDIAPEVDKADEEEDKGSGAINFESLAEEDTKPEDVLNPEFLDENAAETENEEEVQNLDDLIPEDDPLDSEGKDFFDDNPFGTDGESVPDGPIEDDMEPDFEAEEIDDASKADKPLEVGGGEEDESDDAEGVADDAFGSAFDEPPKQPAPAMQPAPQSAPQPAPQHAPMEDAAPVEEELPEEELPIDDSTADDSLPSFEEDTEQLPEDAEDLLPAGNGAAEEQQPLEAAEPPVEEPSQLEEEPEPDAEEPVPLEDEPSPLAEEEQPVAEEPSEEPVILEEPAIPDIPVEDIMSSPEEKDITPEALDESMPEEPVVAEEDSAEQTNEQLFEKATAALPSIVDAIVDKKMVEKYSLTADMFEKLRALSNYLPSDKKQAFLASKTHLLLDYIIARLNGKPGLLATASALRKELHVEDTAITGDSGAKLVGQVFTYMRSFIRVLPDKNIAESLDSAVTQALSKLS